MILLKRRITIRVIADEAGISFGSCEAIFTGVLGMKPAAANVLTNHWCNSMTLKPKTNYQNGSIQKCQNQKKHLKFGQM